MCGAWSNAAVSSPGPTVRIGVPQVRPAEQRDVPRIAATLTIALADSRWTRWALPDDGRMQRLTRLHELDAGHRGVSTGTTWVTDDVTSVASWEAPSGAPGTRPLPGDVRGALERELPRLAADRADAVARTREFIGSLRPDRPHWWLAHPGTPPSGRRRGGAGGGAPWAGGRRGRCGGPPRGFHRLAAARPPARVAGAPGPPPVGPPSGAGHRRPRARARPLRRGRPAGGRGGVHVGERAVPAALRLRGRHGHPDAGRRATALGPRAGGCPPRLRKIFVRPVDPGPSRSYRG